MQFRYVLLMSGILKPQKVCELELNVPKHHIEPLCSVNSLMIVCIYVVVKTILVRGINFTSLLGSITGGIMHS